MEDVVIEYGPGTGAFLQATAAACKFVYAVEVSEAMVVYARQRLGRLGLTNVAFHHQGFLTYEHKGAPAGFVVTKFALAIIAHQTNKISFGFQEDADSCLLIHTK